MLSFKIPQLAIRQRKAVQSEPTDPPDPDVPEPPAGQALLVDSQGNYIVDQQGHFLTVGAPDG